MLRHKMFKGLLVAVACLFLSIPATAKAAILDLTVDGGWQEFDLQPGSLEWKDQFSFNLPTPGILTVTDVGFSGERYIVHANGELLGETPWVISSWDSPADYDQAANDPRWSTGIWNLVPGEYLISGEMSRLVWGGASPVGALRVDTAPVPAPAAGWLLGSALISGLGLRRFRKN